MEVTTVALGVLTLIAAAAAAVYARQTRDDGRSPRLFLEYDGVGTNFCLSNPGKDTAMHIRDAECNFNSVPTQINPSLGAVRDPRQATSRSVVALITMKQAPERGKQKEVVFEYTNSHGGCFVSKFIIRNLQQQGSPNLSEPYEASEKSWKKLRGC